MASSITRPIFHSVRLPSHIYLFTKATIALWLAADVATRRDGCCDLCCSLAIEGSTVRVQSYTAASASTTNPTSAHSDMSHLTEEVFVLDGYYEDIIAMDLDM